MIWELTHELQPVHQEKRKPFKITVNKGMQTHALGNIDGSSLPGKSFNILEEAVTASHSLLRLWQWFDGVPKHQYCKIPMGWGYSAAHRMSALAPEQNSCYLKGRP